MASRHLSRSVVLQSLFECDVKETLSGAHVQEVLARNLAGAAEDADEAFAAFLVRGVVEKQSEIDAIIVKAAPQWPLDKIAPIDRNVLRIGLFELLYGDRSAVPPKVALNEAIELGKSYGGDSSGKFVNGVLGAIYRDIGSPGKADSPKASTPIPHEHLGGVLLTSLDKGSLQIALVHDAFGKWTLPKAKCTDGEGPDSAALRALKEELGVEVPLGISLGEHEYVAHEPGAGRIARTVGYFLASIPEAVGLTCKVCEGISEAKWFPAEDLATLPTYPDLMPIIESGIAAAKSV